MAEPAENKELLGGLYAQDQNDVNGDPESVRAQMTYITLYLVRYVAVKLPVWKSYFRPFMK